MDQLAQESTAIERCRRFTLKDAMILIAALGVGMAFARTAYTESRQHLGRHPIPRGYRAYYAIDSLHAATWPCLASLTFGFLTIRLLPPRPPVLSLGSQPGVAACGVAAWCLTTSLASVAGQKFSVHAFVSVVSIFPGMAVGMTWLLQWASGCWNTEAGWIDVTGRILGALWITSPLVILASFAL